MLRRIGTPPFAVHAYPVVQRSHKCVYSVEGRHRQARFACSLAPWPRCPHDHAFVSSSRYVCGVGSLSLRLEHSRPLHHGCWRLQGHAPCGPPRQGDCRRTPIRPKTPKPPVAAAGTTGCPSACCPSLAGPPLLCQHRLPSASMVQAWAHPHVGLRICPNAGSLTA